MNKFNNVYFGKTVLVTGHTGFKGSWLSIWLHELGAKVVGLSLDPYTSKDNFSLSGLKDKIIDIRGDIRNKETVQNVFDTYNPTFVFHLAAQPIVSISYENPVETYETNVMGTINILESFRKNKHTKVAIMVTTDKCYLNKEQYWGYRETDHLGGYDPYSSSKAAAEIAINSWRQSYLNPNKFEEHGKAVASVRAGNVIGGGDWSGDRIIPDCIKAIENNIDIEIRSPLSIRPWQHVLEPLGGYLMLAEKMISEPIKYSEGWNFGPSSDSVVTVWELANLVTKYYKSGNVVDVSGSEQIHETKMLSLDISKARFILGWSPVLNIMDTVAMTTKWYKEYMNVSVWDLCTRQIREYSEVMSK